MNKFYEARLSMYGTTHMFVDVNNTGAVTAARPELGDINDDLQAAIDAINAQYPVTQTSSLGSTENKEIFKQDVIGQATAIANIVFSYAAATGNPVLKENTRQWKVKSAWDRLKDEEINGQAEVILGYANTAGPSLLVPYGYVLPAVGPPVVTGTTADLESAMSLYGSVITYPTGIIEDRKAANIILVNLFAAADNVIEVMDAMIYPFQFEEIGGDLYNFWVGYKAARNIVGPAVQHTKIKGLITSALTSLPIQGVRVRMIPTPIEGQVPPAQIIEVFTDEFGNYSGYTPKFKNVPYTVIWTKTGYAEMQQTDVFVKLGKPTTINIIMEPGA